MCIVRDGSNIAIPIFAKLIAPKILRIIMFHYNMIIYITEGRYTPDAIKM